MHWVKIYGLVVCSALGYDLLAGGVQCIGLGSMGWWCAVNWVRIYGLVVCSASMGWWCAVHWVMIYGLVMCSALG